MKLPKDWPPIEETWAKAVEQQRGKRDCCYDCGRDGGEYGLREAVTGWPGLDPTKTQCLYCFCERQGIAPPGSVCSICGGNVAVGALERYEPPWVCLRCAGSRAPWARSTAA